MLWHLVTLLPVLGIIQVGAQSRADRYTYLPLIGPTAAVVWLAAAARSGGAAARRVRVALAIGILAALGFAARLQAGFWRDSSALFEHTAAVTRDNYLILTNLGDVLNGAGRFDEALRVLGEAMRANPNHCNARYTIGNSFYLQGQFDKALPPYQDALRCYVSQRASPDYVADVHLYLGNTFLGLDRYREAERHFQSVLLPESGRPGSESTGICAGRPGLPGPERTAAGAALSLQGLADGAREAGPRHRLHQHAAHPERLHALRGQPLAEAGADEHRHLRAAAEHGARERLAVEPRHRQVGDHEVEPRGVARRNAPAPPRRWSSR